MAFAPTGEGGEGREIVALVAFLRGVNVGGHRAFRPRLLAEELAPYEVVNVGAAGTFVIRRPITRAQLRAELSRRLPFAAQVMICRWRGRRPVPIRGCASWGPPLIIERH